MNFQLNCPPAATAAAADVMVKEEPEDEDEAAAGEEEYLPDDEYLAEEFGEWLDFPRKQPILLGVRVSGAYDFVIPGL